MTPKAYEKCATTGCHVDTRRALVCGGEINWCHCKFGRIALLAFLGLAPAFLSRAAGPSLDVIENAVRGDPAAQTKLAAFFAAEKEPDEAAVWYRKAAEQGYADAQSAMGLMYAIGDGVPLDPTQAVDWYRKAAEQGHAAGQFGLGGMYSVGAGVKKDEREAANWYLKAAKQGDTDAQSVLGWVYSRGEGVLKDQVEALAWYNLSAISGNPAFGQARDVLERRLGQHAALLAQARSKELLKEIEAQKWLEGIPLDQIDPADLAPAPSRTGSGAIVSPSGYIVTAAHIVSGAANVEIISRRETLTAIVVRIDEANDLALLKIKGSDRVFVSVGTSADIRLGQSVATIGFPNTEIQGVSPKVTRGEVSSLNGASDDPRMWQISVPIQPGNSGGPLLDEYGSLIGIVVAKLGLKAAAAVGDVPQNVGYAVKSGYLVPLLEPYLAAAQVQPATKRLSFEDMIARAQQAVVLVIAR